MMFKSETQRRRSKAEVMAEKAEKNLMGDNY